MSEKRSLPGDIYKQYLEEKVSQNESYLGEGSEKTVYRHPERPERVVGIFNQGATGERQGYETQPTFLKARFYLTKILHLIHPQNFPNIHLVTENPITVEMDYIDKRTDEDGVKRSEAEQLLFQLHEELGLLFDGTPANFTYGPDHQLIYIDTIEPWIGNGKLMYDPLKIQRAIESLNPAERDVALTYLSRLTQLHTKTFGNK